jgi:hypothetical protein
LYIILTESNSLWCSILRAKYREEVPSNASIWWKDLNLTCFGELEREWFEEEIN